MYTIALDAMGSDNHPTPDVQGGILAARELGYRIILVGDSDAINTELRLQDTRGLQIEVVHAADAIGMADEMNDALISRNESSMHIGMNLVKDNQADAFVTVGNTGAAMGIALLATIHRIPGVKRPALGGIYPVGNKNITLLDLGANSDSKAEWLVQFAIMGHIYAQKMLGLSKPSIALLSNGEEDSKGNQAIKEAREILTTLPLSFIGNVEPKEILQGKADIVVSDGFVGNIFVKTFEASASYLTTLIRDEIKRDVLSMLGGAFAQPAFKRIRKRMDTFEVGGAPLLGVNGVVIIGHGRSNAYAIKNAIRQAGQAVENKIVPSIQQGVAEIAPRGKK